MVGASGGRIITIEETEDYSIKYDVEDRTAIIEVRDAQLRRRLKTPMLYSHDGKAWIKTSGGRMLTTDFVVRALSISTGALQSLQKLFEAQT